MKLNYKIQMIISVVLILLCNVLATVFKNWIFRSIGFIACGFLYLIHPVVPAGVETTKKTLVLVRVAGAFLILFGLFSRSYIY